MSPAWDKFFDGMLKGTALNLLLSVGWMMWESERGENYPKYVFAEKLSGFFVFFLGFLFLILTVIHVVLDYRESSIVKSKQQ